MIFKTTIRFLLRNKAYLALNVVGLALSLACMILITLYVEDEKSWDEYHSKADRIYRIINTTDFNGVGEESSSCPFPVGPTLKSEYPQLVESMVRFFNFQADKILVEYKNKKDYEKNLFFCDSTIFNVFDIELISGSKETCLDKPNTMILSESAAKKYFGSTNPIGKELLIGTKSPIKVTGVFKDQPRQSHLRYDFLGSMSTITNNYKEGLPKTWVWNPVWTYIVLKEGVTQNQLEKQLPNFKKKYFFDAEKEHVGIYLQALRTIHLGKSLDYELSPTTDPKYMNILSGIGFFLILIAIINYVNLSTAFSATRAKEIGVRKTLGSSRKTLILQFFIESFFISTIASLLAVAIVELALPLFDIFTHKDFQILDVFIGGHFFYLFLATVSISILAGIYPAIFLSGFKPIKVLKGTFSRGSKGGTFRKILIITQFSITVFLITGTLSIFDQLNYIESAKLGFNKDQVIVISSENTPLAIKYRQFKRELLVNPFIKSVTTMDYIIGTSHNTHEFRPEGLSNKNWEFYPALVIDFDFLKTFDIKLVAGKDFIDNGTLKSREGILINEAMVKHLKWGKNENAIGKKFTSLNKEENVIGVFKEFNVKSLHSPKVPFVLNIKEIPWEIAHYRKFIAVKINTNNYIPILSFLKLKWEKFAPEHPFQYSILNNELRKQYKGEQNLGQLFALFTIVLLLIACIGLFGLSAYTTAQRTKEIGIRKVLGASQATISKLLFKEYTFLLSIAIMVAIPMAYYTVNIWLSNFAYHTHFKLINIAIAAFISFLISCITVFYHVRKASKTNPSITLKYE